MSKVNLSEIKETLGLVHRIVWETGNDEAQLVYEQLLEELIGEVRPQLSEEDWMLIIDIQDRKARLEDKFPDMSNGDIEEHLFLEDFLSILLEPL